MSVNGRRARAGQAAGEGQGLGGRPGPSTQLAGTGDLAASLGTSSDIGTLPQPEMQELLGEFRALYQERIHRLEALNDGREETLALKVQILQSYINDLSEQNDVLVQTMEELERETNRRVTSLEEELQGYVAKVTGCKEENSILLTTKENLEKQIADLRIKLGSSEDELLKLQGENTNLKTEICNLRTTPEWVRTEQLPSVTLRAMPTEHLSGSTATLPPMDSSEVLMEYEEVKFQLAAKEQAIQSLKSQLREAVYLQQQSKYEVIDKEQKIQELQEMITELHNEMAVKDSENLNQLQDIHHLETKVKALKQEIWQSEESFTQLKRDVEEVRLGSSSGSRDTHLGSPHSTLQENQIQSFRANSLLKAELERRDGTILNLRKEVLLLQEKRDGLTTELDVQERRIYHLQAELREGEAKLEQKQSCLQQLKEELDTTKELHKEGQKQLTDIKGFLAQVESENEMLRTCKLEQNTEIVKLTATIQDLEQSSRNANSVFAANAAQKYKELVSTREELEKKLAKTHVELSEKDGTVCRLRAQVQDASLWAEETKLQLEGVHAELKTMKTKYNLAMNEVGTINRNFENQNIHMMCSRMLSFIIIKPFFAALELEIIGYLMKQRFFMYSDDG
ncbi:uncharacterized protein LOC144493033 [Mustelus asterias]